MKIFGGKFCVSWLVFVAIVIGLATSLSIVSSSKAAGLPDMLVMSSYDVGSGGFIQAAGMADALRKQFKIKVRILPAGNSVARVTTLKTKAAAYGFLADETFFAVEGLYEFAENIWGPQDLRVVLRHPASMSLVATGKSGVKTPADFKGKRVAYVLGSPSINVKTEACLAFAGLSWSDVKKVEYAAYATSLKALVEDGVDVALSITTASVMYELDSSPQGIYWPEFPASDKEGWARLQKIAPWLFPGTEDRGAGMKQGQPREIPIYCYPQIVTYADRSPDEVYALAKALHETFGLYKDINPVMVDWELTKGGRSPAGAPFHEGAIRYFKEQGVWKAEDDQWNSQFLSRLKKVQDAWKKTVEEAGEQQISEKKFPDFWMKKRSELVRD